jgi:hypothetical protein
MTNLKPREQVGAEPAEPCDPERLKVLEDAMREAIETYLTFTDPYNRMSRDEALGRLIEILDRREVAEAANVPDEQSPPEAVH